MNSNAYLEVHSTYICACMCTYVLTSYEAGYVLLECLVDMLHRCFTLEWYLCSHIHKCNLHTHTHTHAHMHVDTHAQSSQFQYYTHAHTHKHTHTHTHTHTSLPELTEDHRLQSCSPTHISPDRRSWTVRWRCCHRCLPGHDICPRHCHTQCSTVEHWSATLPPFAVG